MIDFWAVFRRRKGAEPKAQNALPDEKVHKPEPNRPSRFMGGACEKTQDLLAGHDGERVGFRKPVQG